MWIAQMLADRAVTIPDKRYIIDDDTGAFLTYASAEAESRALAELLAQLAPPGARAVIYGDGLLERALALLACAKAGLVDVFIDPQVTAKLLETMLRKSDPRLAITSPSGAQRLREALEPDILNRIHLVIVGGAGGVEVNEARGGAVNTERDAGTPCRSIRFTSGSTGMPKGVMFSDEHILRKATVFNDFMGFTEPDVLYSPFPMHHSLASTTGVLSAMLASGTVVLRRKFSVSQYWDRVRQHSVTLGHIMDPPMKMLLSRAPSASDRDHQVRQMYAAQTSPAEFERRFGLNVVRVYSMSELNVVALDDRKGSACEDTRRCCGRVADRFTVIVRDEQGALVPAGQEGEVFVRPTGQNDVFVGYFGDDAYTVSRWRDLWFSTGDRGYRTDANCLHITGRVGGRLRRRGVNLSAEAIERAVEELPGVAECVAVGVPSELGEDELLVVITLSEGEVFDRARFRAHVERSLPSSHRPRFVRIVDEMPKTATEKVDRAAAAATAGVDWDTQHSPAA
jgi:crotonobetaine/carnitine-CoA ligase